MLMLSLAAALAATPTPTARAEWWLLEVEHPREEWEIFTATYADRASLATGGGLSRISARAVAERQGPGGWIAAEFRLEIRCAANELRMASAQPRDSDGRPAGPLEVNSEGFMPIGDGMGRRISRLACSDDRSGFTRLPEGMDASVHAAGLFAELRRPPPPPPPPTAEEEARLIEGARLIERERTESAARHALVEACGEAASCHAFEAETMRGVVPVVAVEGLACSEAAPRAEFRRDCRFEARHTGNGRALSCTFEMREQPGHHGSYWSHRRPPPPAPPPPPREGSLLPSLPPPWLSTLACSGAVAALVAP